MVNKHEMGSDEGRRIYLEKKRQIKNGTKSKKNANNLPHPK